MRRDCVIFFSNLSFRQGRTSIHNALLCSANKDKSQAAFYSLALNVLRTPNKCRRFLLFPVFQVSGADHRGLGICSFPGQRFLLFFLHGFHLTSSMCIPRKTMQRHSSIFPIDKFCALRYNPCNQIGQFVTILSVNKTRDFSDGRTASIFCWVQSWSVPIFCLPEEFP